MNKKELISKISIENNIEAAKTEEVVNAIFSTIVDELKAGEDVKIPGKGTRLYQLCKQVYSKRTN